MSVDDNCGFVGPAFVEWLFKQGYADDPATLEQRVNDAQKWLLGDGEHSGVEQAAARTLAIAYVAGKLAIEAGLLPVVDGRDIDADFRTAWLRSMGDADRMLRDDSAGGAVGAGGTDQREFASWKPRPTARSPGTACQLKSGTSATSWTTSATVTRKP